MKFEELRISGKIHQISSQLSEIICYLFCKSIRVRAQCRKVFPAPK